MTISNISNFNPDKRPKIGVGVLVFKDNHLLLGKRINAHGGNTWCPAGGHLEYGETPIQCAKRELFEEAGLIANKVIQGPWTNDVFEKEQKHYVTLFMIVTEFSGTLENKEPDKCLGWGWYPIDNLPSPLFQTVQTCLENHSMQDLFGQDFNESVL